MCVCVCVCVHMCVCVRGVKKGEEILYGQLHVLHCDSVDVDVLRPFLASYLLDSNCGSCEDLRDRFEAEWQSCVNIIRPFPSHPHLVIVWVDRDYTIYMHPS